MSERIPVESEILEKQKENESRQSPPSPPAPASPHQSDSEFFEDDESGEEKMDFNLKATIAHLQGDLVYSVGVFISAVIINIFPDLRFFDSICTLLFSYVAVELTVPIFNEAIRILLEGTPEGKFPLIKKIHEIVKLFSFLSEKK